MALEAREALDDVPEEARLALLAVGDDIDTGVRLPANNVGDRLSHQPDVGLAVPRLAPFLRNQDLDQGVGPRQTANVRGENPVCTTLHPRAPPYRSGPSFGIRSSMSTIAGLNDASCRRHHVSGCQAGRAARLTAGSEVGAAACPG